MAGLALHYRVGNEHDPSDPFGRSELHVGEDGVVHLEQIERTARRTFRTSLLPEAAERLRAALAAAPAALPLGPPPVAGATLRTLTHGEGAAARVVVVEWHAGARTPGYRDVFAVLDAIVAQLLGRSGAATLVTGVHGGGR
jgi:hypothetical protein